MLLGMLLCGTAGFAQTKFGVKAGLNISSLPGDYPVMVENKSKAGFHAGFTTEIGLNAKWALLGELLVSTQGGKASYSPDGVETLDQTIKLTNLNVPVLLRYTIIDKFTVEAGPQIGFVLSGKNKLEYTNSADPSQNETIELNTLKGGTFISDGMVYSYEKGVRPVDFSVNLGLTYNVLKKLYVQARYNRGLTSVDTKSTVNSSIKSLDTKNSVFQLSVGYLFN